MNLREDRISREQPLGLETLAEVRAYLKGHRAGFNSAMRQWEQSIDELLDDAPTPTTAEAAGHSEGGA